MTITREEGLKVIGDWWFGVELHNPQITARTIAMGLGTDMSVTAGHMRAAFGAYFESKVPEDVALLREARDFGQMAVDMSFPHFIAAPLLRLIDEQSGPFADGVVPNPEYWQSSQRNPVEMNGAAYLKGLKEIIDMHKALTVVDTVPPAVITSTLSPSCADALIKAAKYDEIAAIDSLIAVARASHAAMSSGEELDGGTIVITRDNAHELWARMAEFDNLPRVPQIECTGPLRAEYALRFIADDLRVARDIIAARDADRVNTAQRNVDTVQPVELLTMSPPCSDFSRAQFSKKEFEALTALSELKSKVTDLLIEVKESFGVQAARDIRDHVGGAVVIRDIPNDKLQAVIDACRAKLDNAPRIAPAKIDDHPDAV